MVGVQEQRAQLGLPGEVVGEEQRGNLAMDTELLRGADDQADAVVVPGLAQADGAGDGGNPHHLAVIVFEHEQVVGVGALGLAAKSLLCPTDTVRQALLVGRQGGQAGAGAPRQIEQGRQVGAGNGTNDHAGPPQTAIRRTLAPSPTPRASAASRLRVTGLPGTQSSSATMARKSCSWPLVTR
ncbi:hypothetical protein D3C78_1013460 [compost metagenome]